MTQSRNPYYADVALVEQQARRMRAKWLRSFFAGQR